MLPLNMLIYLKGAYGESVAVAWPLLLASIGTVVSGVGCGLLISSKLEQRLKNRANLVGNAAGLVLMVYSSLVSSRKDPIWNRDATFYYGVGLPFAGGLVAAVGVTTVLGLGKPERVAIVVETCYQNIGIGPHPQPTPPHRRQCAVLRLQLIGVMPRG